MTPTEEELNDQLNKAIDSHGRWPGMSYEQGVEAALRWANGDTDEKPMEDE